MILKAHLCRTLLMQQEYILNQLKLILTFQLVKRRVK